MPKQKRDNTYYLERLKIDFPIIYTDYLSGKYSSVREAFIAAGLVKATSELNLLKRTWKRANRKERSEFLNWIGAGALAKVKMTSIVDANNFLLPAARIKIMRIMHVRSITNGQIMTEIGFKVLDASLGMAMRDSKATKIRLALAKALTDWVNKH